MKQYNRGQLLTVARDMATEYHGQSQRAEEPIREFELLARGQAMDEFITRVHYLEAGEPPAAPMGTPVIERPI